MARKKTNRYRIVTDGLKIENSLYADWCQDKTDEDIIKAILISSGYVSVLKSFLDGKRDIKLVGIRIHKEMS